MTKLKFEDPRHRAWARLLRVQRRVIDAAQRRLSEAGFPGLEWYDVLLELQMAPQKRLRQTELGDRIVLEKSNLTRLVDRMESQGYVSRTPCEKDKRSKYVSATQKGKELLRSMWPVYREVIDERFGKTLSKEDGTLVAEILGRIN